MKFWIEEDTLIVHGRYNALSSGIGGGWKDVEYLFNHTVSKDFERWNPTEYLKSVAERYSMKSYFGLLTSVPMKNLAIVSVDEVTVFVTAGVKNPNEQVNLSPRRETNTGTINIIIVVKSRMTDAAMVNTVITATEAKSSALLEMGYQFTGTCTDAVIVAKELDSQSKNYYEYAGPSSVLGRKIWKATKRAVRDSLLKY